MDNRLTPAEDAELRRLAALATFGVLSDAALAVFEELRNRDRRTAIRPVQEVLIPQPRPATDGPYARSG
ncbi:MAG: hypothetical protein QOJ03_1059 [Frankiaceae bacterium]|nr:hypothetical protein [Frankiaceae bacterium]